MGRDDGRRREGGLGTQTRSALKSDAREAFHGAHSSDLSRRYDRRAH